MKPLFYGIVKNNKPILSRYQLDRYNHHLLGLEDKEVQISVEKKKTLRSLKLNSYYWGVVISMTAMYFGYTDDEMHAVWGQQFLLTKDDKGFEYVRSTASLTNPETLEYHEKVKMFMAQEYSFVVPDPNSGIEF